MWKHLTKRAQENDLAVFDSSTILRGGSLWYHPRMGLPLYKKIALNQKGGRGIKGLKDVVWKEYNINKNRNKTKNE